MPRHTPIPPDHPVQPLAPDQLVPGRTTCGYCGLSWDDDQPTSLTPVPSARCPFEYFHKPDPVAEQEAKFESDYWAEHPDYPVADWQHEVAEDNTRQSYREWVLQRLEEAWDEEDEEENETDEGT